MISFLRPPLRAAGPAAVPSLSSAAVTLLGLRVTRHQILRMSALLTLRTVLSHVSLPLDAGVQTYLWNFLFSSAQAGIAVAAAASVLNLGGYLAAVLNRVLPPAADAAFVSLFANLVLLAGPLVATLEVAVLVFLVMRLARRAEAAMFRSEHVHQTTSPIRALLLSVAAFAFLLVAVLLFLVFRFVHPPLAAVAALAVFALFASAVAFDDANVVEASALSVYVLGLLFAALVEEAALDAPVLGLQWRRLLPISANSLIGDTPAAALLVSSLLLLLVSMSHLPRFALILLLGHDAAQQSDTLQPPLQQQPPPHPQQLPPSVADAAPVDGLDDKPPTPPPSFPNVLVSVLTLLAATFRVLVWTTDIHQGEYLPVACRVWQIFLVVLLYIFFNRL